MAKVEKYRDIVFRGKRIDADVWVEGFLSKGRYYAYKGGTLQPAIEYDENGLMISSVIKPETVGQYIGLRDADGVRAFEGDIIVDTTGGGEIGVILWDSDEAAFMLCVENILTAAEGIWAYRIIGNIHDNPEYLEAVENEQQNYRR